MDIPISKVAERLNLEEDVLKNAIERRVITLCKYRDKRYLVFKKKVRHVERGTVLFLNERMDVVMGYPKIRRALVLDPTVKKYFIDQVVVEEKLNGYNVRVVNIDNEILGITRGGRICPFTTKKVLKLLNTDILKDHPKITLCGEMIGLNNPYVPHYYPEVDREIYRDESTVIRENLGLYIFDIREGDRSLPVEERNKLLEEYNVPYVKPLGVFNKEEIEEIKSTVVKLDRENREGIVMKDPSMLVDPIKYTTHYTHCQDLAVAFRYTFDLGIHFMFSRLIREGFQSYEFNEGEKEMERRALSIGKSIIYPMVESIKEVARGELITEDFELYFDSEEDVEEFLRYLKEVHISYVVKEREVLKNRIFRVIIGKVYPSTRDKIKSYLGGSLW
ncbi:MAG TPA: RNA ligase [Methanothermococcus okinawensis]|uniref:RNA ligase n=1 Tax=Methanothermococcus okinawensis TaxID=155863 RepID=A0A833E6L8_9EURY|nr:RNA ligase [Methanococcaceae archaeon]HIP83973.1 RNA ligase [Methanothermococcus okinawensis]HIP91570.1 RNA ligase [Methanothermococcus okinawensis]